MQKIKKNRFWSRLEKWQSIFKAPKNLSWHDEGWLENEYCGDCRYCCGPQGSDEPFPMALLPNQISARTPDDFYLLDKNTAYLGREGCKSETGKGCRLPRELRPVSCGLFPIVLANGRLYLYKTCPAVIFNSLDELCALAEKAAAWLAAFPLEELRHISLNLSSEKLAADYIDLGIEIFSAEDRKS